jgi:thioredoxin 1
MKKYLTLLLALCTVTALASDFPKGSPKFKDKLTSVTRAAEKSGKPMVVVFSAVWCPPCQMMKKEVYPSAEVAALHDKFEWAYLDVDDNDNEKASAKYGVEGIPHIEFLGADGKSLDKQVGSSDPASFAKKLQEVLQKAGKKS